MKTNYPRIYSLSTLGIIYHFNTDYPFHVFRTDFSGDGGSGKTMIADIIQLILVGSGVYKSSTEGNDDRPIEEMVLKPKNQRYGAGYIWLNVEVSPGKFIVIGAFIEKSSKQVRMFIAQTGFNWDTSLEPLTKPVYYKDLLIKEKIVPVEDILDKIQNLHIKTFPLKQYHRILFDNGILPFDLTDDKTLDSYASIFRAFSRGSGFKKDSKSLKVFLFGDEDKSLLNKYYDEIKSINDDYKEHDRYKKEIDLITRKQDFIKDVVSLEGRSKALENQYLSNKVLYWQSKQKKNEEEFEKIRDAFNESRVENQLLNALEAEFKLEEFRNKATTYTTSKATLQKISTKKSSLLQEKSEKYEKFKACEQIITNINLVEKWLRDYGNIELVKQNYQEEIIYKEEKELLEEFSAYLGLKELKESFESSDWFNDFENTKNKYEAELQKANLKLEELNSLLVFSDLQNPNSLAKWAMDHFKDPINKEEESILRYFQLFPRNQQKDTSVENRYLPFPEELFQNLDIKNPNIKGFWLNLDGVYEFIDYVPKQYLNISQEKKKALIGTLSKLTQDVKEELSIATNKIEQQKVLKKVLFDFPGVEKAVTLYSKKNKFERAWDTKFTSLDVAQFDNYLIQFNNRETLKNEYDKTKESYEKIIRLEDSSASGEYETRIKDIESYFSNLGISPDDTSSHLIVLENNYGEQNKLIVTLQLELGLTDSQIAKIKNKLFIGKISYNSILELKANKSESFVTSKNNYETAIIRLNESKEKSKQAQQDYLVAFKHKFSFENEVQSPVRDPDEDSELSLKFEFTKALSEFHAKYDIVAKEMEEGAQLVGTYHVGQLAHRLLPNVFTSTKEIDETHVNAQLTDRLNKLYQTIKEIGSRKIEILKRVFTEVNKTYRDYLEKVTKIDQYFKNPSKSITGGNRGSLKYILSADYPAKWMSVFGRILDDQLPNFGLFEKLADEIDINEMMIKAFINEGGTKEADIEDLLNPKSYFDLTFDLQLENGDNNAGSNSQTYSGNALLGLARLSILGDSTGSGIHIMPIDEAQSLGSNYEMLRNIAIEEGYQILTMSIDTAGEIRDGEQYMYILSENKLLDEDNYVPAMGIFSDGPVTPNIEEFVYANDN